MESLYNDVGNFFTEILAQIYAFSSLVYNLAGQIVSDIGAVLRDFFFYMFESILDLAITLLDSIPFINFPNFFVDLPPEVLNVIGHIGLAESMTMIVSSLGIRMALQLIPFIRLGS